MQAANFDAVEREALAYLVRVLEAGRTHVLVDTFLPFLKSIDAGSRLVAILTYFEGLEILTPERPPGSQWNRGPLVGIIIPAYWRIEGKAVILYRALGDQKAGQNESPEEGKRRRGRPADTDSRADKKIWDAWASGNHETYAELARHLGRGVKEVARAIDRHRHRLARVSSRRRTNAPDQ